MHTVLVTIRDLGVSFIGSLCAFVIAQHYHLEDHWAERKERIEAKRARKRWEKSPEFKREREVGVDKRNHLL